MAGIGFKIRNILKKDLLSYDISAILYAILVTSGPWIISSVYIFLLSVFLKKPDYYFSGVVIYSFIFSMIISGGFSFLLTRYIADLLYKRDYLLLYRTYSGSVIFISGISIFISGMFYMAHSYAYTPFEIFLGMAVFTMLSAVWVQTLFVSATEKLSPVIYGFLVGFSTSAFLSFTLKGLENHLLVSLVIGLAIIIYFNNFFICKYFRMKKGLKPSFEFLKAIKEYPENLLIGFIYYFGVWVDDFVAWYMMGNEISPGFVLLREYDTAMFISYLLIIPAMSLFVLQIETDFYKEYRTFYSMLEKNFRLDLVKLQFKRLSSVMSYTIKNIFSLQFSLMIIGLILSEPFSRFLGIGGSFLWIFRFAVVGVSANLIFLTLMLLALYFDFRSYVLKNVSLLFVLNFFLSIFTMKKLPGLSFALSFSIVSFIFMLTFRIDHLLYITYTKISSGLEKTFVKHIKIKGA